MLRIPGRPHPPHPARLLSTQTSRRDVHRPLDSKHDTTPSIPHFQSRGVFLRPWDGIGSMAEAFAILRGVEKKYGRIREFRVFMDYEVQQQYQSYLLASFRDSASYDLIPVDAAVIQVPVPKGKGYRDGGIGLDDLEGVLVPCERALEEGNEGMREWGGVVQRLVEEENEAGERKEGNGEGMKVVDVRVERSSRPFHMPCPRYPAEFETAPREKKLALGHAWLDWGGFAGVRPLEQSPFVSSSSSSTAADTITSPHLRSALSKWAAYTRRDDPSISVSVDITPSPEPAPENTTLSLEAATDVSPPLHTPPKDWDPLPPSPPPPDTSSIPSDVDLTPATTPMPSPTPISTTPKAPRHSRKQRKLLSAKEVSISPSDVRDALQKKERKWADGMEKEEEATGMMGRVKKLFGGWL